MKNEIQFSSGDKFGNFYIDKDISGMKSEELIGLIKNLKSIAIKNGFIDIELTNDYDFYFFRAIK